MVKLWSNLFILVIVGQNILGIIVKDWTSKKPHSSHNLRHSIVNKKHGHHKSFLKTRLETKRCTIFCPIIIIFQHSNATSSSPKPTKNSTTSRAPSVKLTTKPTSSKKPLGQEGKKLLKKNKGGKSQHGTDLHKKHNKSKLSRKKHKTKNHGKFAKKVEKRHYPHERVHAATTNATKSRKKIIAKKYSYHDLNSNRRKKHKTKNHGNPGKVAKKVEKRHSPHERVHAVTTNATKSRKKIIAKNYSYHDLNANQKRLVLKQLNLGNSNGKKPYEFREISTSQCRVVCMEEYVEDTTVHPQKTTKVHPQKTTTVHPQKTTTFHPQKTTTVHPQKTTTVHPQKATTNRPQKVSTTESEDSDEDSFEENEDKPIEATVKPAKPLSIVIGGIRPFGHVNFNGFDDFGPSGELAKDIPRPGEKNKKKAVDKGKHFGKHNKIIS